MAGTTPVHSAKIVSSCCAGVIRSIRGPCDLLVLFSASSYIYIYIVGYFFVVLGKVFAYFLGYFLQSHIKDNSLERERERERFIHIGHARKQRIPHKYT